LGLEFCVLVDPVKGVVRGLMPPELAICASAGGSGGVALVEGLNEQSFDDGLTADVQVFGVFEFFQHSGGEIYALDGVSAFRRSSWKRPQGFALRYRNSLWN
jgi:hypothetical protein